MTVLQCGQWCCASQLLHLPFLVFLCCSEHHTRQELDSSPDFISFISLLCAHRVLRICPQLQSLLSGHHSTLQHFYAQCSSCSLKQASLLRHGGGRNPLVMHRLTPPGVVPGEGESAALLLWCATYSSST